MDETAYRQFIELEETHFWFVGRRRIFFDLLDRELDGRADATVLDVGCGAGGMLGYGSARKKGSDAGTAGAAIPWGLAAGGTAERRLLASPMK